MRHRVGFHAAAAISRTFQAILPQGAYAPAQAPMQPTFS
jgi:hypothetical protein